jgi:excisionase family DNA binding protein
MITISPSPPKQELLLEPIAVNLQKAAALLDISERTLWQLVRENKIPHKYIGKRLLFSIADLRKFVSSD